MDLRPLSLRIQEKLKELLASAKFWSLLAALAAIAGGYFTQTVPADESLRLALYALLSFAGLKVADDALGNKR